jgi:hypothetical protein
MSMIMKCAINLRNDAKMLTCLKKKAKRVGSTANGLSNMCAKDCGVAIVRRRCREKIRP